MILPMKKLTDTEKRILIKIAKMYYFEELTQQEIANFFDISRSKVSRSLTQAKEQGIVHIYIDDEFSEEQLLEKSLRDKFGIHEVCVVNETASNPEALYHQMGGVLTRILDNKLRDGDTLGLTAGFTLNSISGSMGAVVRKNLHIVPLIGGIGVEGAPWQINQAMMVFSEKLKADYFVMNAPSYCSSETAREILLNEPEIRRVLDMIRKCSVAVVGIGEMSESATLLSTNSMRLEDIQELKAKHTAASIGTNFFDKDGRLIDAAISKRTIGATIQDLRTIPNVIAIAHGVQKAAAITSALRSGLVDILITDIETAKLIDQET